MKPGRDRYPEGRAKCLLPRAALFLCSTLVILAFLLAPATGAESLVGADGRTIFDWFCTPSWTDAVAGVGAAEDNASDVVMTKGSVIFVGGSRMNAAGNTDVTLTKYKSGVKQWTVDYDGRGHDDDQCTRIALSPDGKSVYEVGGGVNAAGNADLIVIKRSARSGALKWARRYDGSAHRDDVALAVGVDAWGNVVAAGFSMNATDLDCVLVSWNQTGTRRWVVRYKGPGTNTDMWQDLVVSPDGTAYAGGFSAGPPTTGLITAVSPWGTRLWLKKYTGPAGLSAMIAALAPRPAGGVYAAGSTLGAGTGSDAFVARYSPKGKRTVLPVVTGGGGATSQSFVDVAVTSTKQVVAVGQSDTGATTDPMAAVYTRDETAFNSIALPSAWNDGFTSVATDKLGGWYATGTWGVAVADTKILTVRGSVLTGGGGFFSTWGPSVSTGNWPMRIAVRGTTACVVGEYESGGATGIDQAVLTFIY